jgi:RecA/RadA recombinase
MPTPKDVERALAARPKRPKPPGAGDLLSSGSTLVNLVLSGRTGGAFKKGKYYFWPGDSNTGKSWCALTTLAEAANNPAFDGYRLIHIDVEYGADMDKEYHFGKKAAARIETVHLETVEEFYDFMDDLQKGREPFVAFLDSQDALRSRDEDKKYAKNKAVRRRKTSSEAAADKETGSYGDGKAKIHSANLRRVVSKLEAAGSILVILNQTRDRIGFGAQYDPKTYSGGNALAFYACCRIWSSLKEVLKRRAKGKDREVGTRCKIRVRRNRLTGKNRSAFLDIYADAGVDDVGSCINYLVEEGHWEAKKAQTGKISAVAAPEFDFEGSPEDLVALIEENDRERELRGLVAKVWQQIEDEIAVVRKRRYK